MVKAIGAPNANGAKVQTEVDVACRDMAKAIATQRPSNMGPRAMDMCHAMGHVPWAMLWAMGHGAWTMGHVPCYGPCYGS